MTSVLMLDKSRCRRVLATTLTRLGNRILNAGQKERIVTTLPPKIRDSLMELVEPGYRRRIGGQDARARVGAIETKLFDLGLVEPALAELQEMAARDGNAFERREAAWCLAKWGAGQDRDEHRRECLQWLSVASAGETDARRLCLLAIAEAECMAALGDRQGACQRIDRQMERDESVDLLLASANLVETREEKIQILNTVLSRSGLSPIGLKPDDDRPTFDRLCGTMPPDRARLPAMGGPTVTVIVTAYNAATTIQTALDSLLAQTWPFLEIIAVDDGSNDDTPQILKEYAESDKRIRVLTFETNRGTYVCRNEALMRATSEFVTCHDADDWSHPEKIERQVTHLMTSPELMANMSLLIRADNDLNLFRPMLSSRYAIDNFSSLMFRRQMVRAKVGFWDSVRFACDGEYMRRIERVFGVGTVGSLSGIVLAVARKTSSSLTGCQSFGMWHSFMGARREYVDSSEFYYHRTKNCLREYPMVLRPFPVPEPMWPHRVKRISQVGRFFNVVVASDLRLADEASFSVNLITAWREQGSRCGLIQIPKYAVDPDQPIDAAVREVIDGHHVQLIVFGERITCNLLVLSPPCVLRFKNRFLPEVQAARTCVLFGGDVRKDCGGDIESCRANVEEWVGKADWVSVSDVPLSIIQVGNVGAR